MWVLLRLFVDYRNPNKKYFIVAIGCLFLHLFGLYPIFAYADSYSWVSHFKDPLLVSTVEEALKNNYDMQKAVARLEAAQAVVKRAEAGLRPILSLNMRGVQLTAIENSDSNRFAKGVSADLVWDVDVWGEAKLELGAQRSHRNAFYSDLNFIRQLIVTKMAKTWFLVIESRLELGLSEEAIEHYRKILEIVESKYQAGIVSKQDINQTRADLARAKEAFLQVKGAYSEAMQALKLLLGREPEVETAISDTLPELPLYYLADNYEHVFAQREDILAAGYRRDAASLNFNKEKKKNYPNLQLDSSVNKLSKELNILTNSNDAFVAYGASSNIRLLDGGKNKADIQVAQAKLQEVQKNYQSKSLEVKHEIQTELLNEKLLRERKEYLESLLADTKDAVALAQRQYETGKIDLITFTYYVLKENEIRIKLLHLKVAQLMNRADLYSNFGENQK